MNSPFDFSEIPHTFGMCSIKDCPNAATCLRQIVTEHVPDNIVFLTMLNPNWFKAQKGKCRFYRSNEKVRFALGFIRTTNALTVSVVNSFRNQMISRFGRKNYYLKRRGSLKITPNEQAYIISVAKKLGVVLDEYFDNYTEEYNWRL